ncbi:MAG: ethylbenzene dehydrogenase-related protein, partial [Chitinophagaceae bacterium]
IFSMKTMKSKYLWVIATLVLSIGYVVSCTKDDQVIETPEALNGNELFAAKTTAAPTIDGIIDGEWDKAQKLTYTATMPDPGNGLWAGYQGQTFPGTIRSMYDDQNIYFLVEVPDADKNINVSPWYFDPVTKLWNKEPGSRTLDADGKLLREGFGKDQFAMLWDIDNSNPKFTSQTCYASCHIFTPYMDYSLTPAVYKANNSGNHYTNAQSEKIDQWWIHPQRGMMYGFVDDNYQDWAGGPAVVNLAGGNGNGRHLDDQIVNGASTTWPYRPSYTSDATQGSANNQQNLKLDGTGATVAVPLWIIPNSITGLIKVEDTLSGGTAIKITAVSSTGVLSYSGGSIDPNTGTEYQRLGNLPTSGVGAKCFPSVILSTVKNGRADISLGAVYTGSAWIYEFKRKLKTGDVLKQDVDFSSLKDQPFGVAYFDKSNYQHAIKPNLVLKFKK